ncbi:histidinolphosphatase [Ascosphaera aggregata]|nr:histidinolphosphatase [Ascosphaera aggregata]
MPYVVDFATEEDFPALIAAMYDSFENPQYEIFDVFIPPDRQLGMQRELQKFEEANGEVVWNKVTVLTRHGFMDGLVVVAQPKLLEGYTVEQKAEWADLEKAHLPSSLLKLWRPVRGVLVEEDQLEHVIQTAIALKMRTFCLTEHMARGKEDLYPEELEKNLTEESLVETVKSYFQTARQLREKYKGQINIPIGFEGEWIRPSTLPLVETALRTYPAEFFIGSVHHTLSIPIDFDRKNYEAAREKAGGTDELIFCAYFDEQFDMLKALSPPIIGHFDLIRLFSDHPNESMKRFPEVWEKLLRNLTLIANYGGILEISSSSLRKGMNEPYPKADICQEFLSMGGRFCLSDDSHGTAQIGLNYHRVLAFIEKTGINEVYYLEHVPTSSSQVPTGDSGTCAEEVKFDHRFPETALKRLDLATLKTEPFWQSFS